MDKIEDIVARLGAYLALKFPGKALVNLYDLSRFASTQLNVSWATKLDSKSTSRDKRAEPELKYQESLVREYYAGLFSAPGDSGLKPPTYFDISNFERISYYHDMKAITATRGASKKKPVKDFDKLRARIEDRNYTGNVLPVQHEDR